MTADTGGYAYGIESRTTVSASPAEAFAFLVRPESLPALDPPWVAARLLTGAHHARAVGAEAEYVLRWFDIPLYLRLVVTELDAPHRFALAQASGPWRSYTHTFELHAAAGGTEVRERAEFRGGRGLFELCLHRFVVRRQLHQVVRFRRVALARALGAVAADSAWART